MEKPVPALFVKKEDCCGCTACMSACVKNIIVMQLDEEGFFYPEIENNEECIRCYRCLKVCPMKEVLEENG